MTISELIAGLEDAKQRHGDLPVVVSVDMDDGEDTGKRCFGEIIAWNPGGGMPAPEIVLLAENGTLNYA